MPGQTIARRNFRGPYLSWAQAVRVISDDDQGLLVWLPVGADFAHRVGADGHGVRAGTVEDFGRAKLVLSSWRESSLLMFHPPKAAHSVWWFFRDGSFSHWYVNLESPYLRTADGIANVDHHLDLIVQPDGRWQWKDEDDFAESIGEPGYWDAEQAREIRREGLRAVAAIEAAAFPFNGRWCDFAAPAAWPVPRLPDRDRLAAGHEASGTSQYA
jgi:protein associated with RNAse G/E